MGKRRGFFALRSVAEATQGNVLYLDRKLKAWDTFIIINVVRFNNKFSRYTIRDLKNVKIKQNGFFLIIIKIKIIIIIIFCSF